MKTKGRWELIWTAMIMGGLLTTLTIVSLRADRDPVAQIELKSKCIALINAMRLALAATSEEQNCAVLATSEQHGRGRRDNPEKPRIAAAIAA